MSSIFEQGLRLVHLNRELGEEASAEARTDTNVVCGEIVCAESSARAQELVTEQVPSALKREPAPNSTLSGVLPFAATHTPHSSFHGTPLYVAPATVTAIANAKARPKEASVETADAAIAHGIDGAKLRRFDVVRPSAMLPVSVPLAKADQPEVTIVDAQTPIDKWEKFDDIGLAPKPVTKKAQRLLISTYRLLGFGILTLIVVVLLGYIGTTAFYFLNHSWITPVAISPNDEKVVGLQGELAAQLNVRAQLVADLEQSERAIRSEQAFQMQFARAIKKDLYARRRALGRVQELASVAAATRNEIRAASDEFSASSASKLDQDYNARLIDSEQALAGKYQLAQITSAKLSLAERQAEFDQRAAELQDQTGSLDAILADKTLTAALSYDVLKIARDYETSKLALARELDNRERLTESIDREDQIIAGVKQSAYLRALEDDASVALVPYDNLGNIKEGTPLYACRFEMVLCRKVGKVLEVLPGEVPLKHPTRESILRGRMIVMEMVDKQAAQREVLFAGRAPLGI